MGTALQTKPADTLMDKPTSFIPFASKDEITLSVALVLKFICVPTKSGARCTPEQAAKFIMLCKARGLNPFEGDAFIVGYDSKNDGPTFSLITGHQAFLKRAEVHPEFDGMKSGVIVMASGKEGPAIIDREGDFTHPGDRLLGGWATVYFKKRSQPMHKRLKLETFDTQRSRWAKDPAGMIVKCAEADALRSSFPTQLGGMYCGEEMGVSDRTTGVDRPDYQPSSRTIKSVPIDQLKLEAPPAPQDAQDEPPVQDESSQPEAPEEASQEPPASLWRTQTLDQYKQDAVDSGQVTGTDWKALQKACHNLGDLYDRTQAEGASHADLGVTMKAFNWLRDWAAEKAQAAQM